MNRLAFVVLLLSAAARAQPRPVIDQDTQLPDGRVGLPYTQTISVHGGTLPYNWQVSSGSLPPGISLVPLTGTLAGIPTRTGDYEFELRVTDAQGESRDKRFRLTINSAAPPPANPPTIQTSGLPPASAGTTYTQTLTVSGGTPPYTWSVTSGTLPVGIALNSSTGVLSGTPTAAGTSTFTVRVSDAQNSVASRSLSLVVNAPPLTVTTTTVASGQVGRSYSQTLTAIGGTGSYTWSISAGALPDALTLASNGTIAGTPTVAGNFDFTVRVRDEANTTVTQPLRISVAAIPLAISTTSLPGGQAGQAYSATLSSSGGTAPYTWTLASGSLPAGLMLSPSGSISGTPTTSGTSDFTIRVTDSATATATQALRMVISAAPTPPLTVTTAALTGGGVGQTYTQSLSASGGTQPYTWTISAGSLPAGLTLAASGVISGTPTTAGDFDFTARVTDGANGTATRPLRITIAAAPASPISVTTTTVPSGNSGQPYSFSLAASGGTSPYAWTQDAGVLPAGLTLNPSGILSGTPTVAGNFDFSVRVTDSANASATRALRVTISQAGNPLAISSDTLPRPTAGQPLTASLAASGGTPPYSWAVAGGTLPAGVTLSTTGVLAGTPASSGDFDFLVRVSDASSTAITKALRLSVNPAPASLSITTTSVPPAIVATQYSQTLTAVGGRAPYTWSVIQGSLPPGIGIEAAAGRLVGTPLAAGSYSATVRVTDADNKTSDRVFTIIVGGALSIACPSSTAARSTPYSAAFSATGGTAPYFWSVASGQLPPGVTLNASAGTLTGTPTNSGSFAFAATVADASGATATRSCNINVEAPLEILTDTLPDATTRAPYSQRLRSQGGTAPFSWSISSGTLPPGLSLDPPTGAISGQPTQPGRFTFAAQVADATGRQLQRALSISVATGLTIPSCPTATTAAGQMFNSALVAIGGVTPYSWSVGSGALPQGLTLAPDTGLISGRATQSGSSEFAVNVTDAAGASATRTCSIAVAPEFRMLTGAIAGARLRSPYTQLFEAQGGTAPYVWLLSAGALPPGLTLDSTKGEITGTPAVAGTFRFAIKAVDAAGLEVERPFEIVVAAGLVVNACPTPAAVAEEPYSAGVSVSNAQPPVVWAVSSGSLPDGLSLSPETGTINGVPTLPGTFEFAIRATDASSDAAGRTCSIVVAPAALRISAPESLADAILGSAYEVSILAAGGQAPYLWLVSEGTLPPGITLDGNGTLQGTPSAAGTYRFSLQVGDQNSTLATRPFELRVLAGTMPRVTFSDLPEIVTPAQQPRVRLTLDSTYPADLRGTLTLRFRPDPGLMDDPSIRFITGSRSTSFTVQANTTDVVFAVPELALQTGSVAGTIELSARLFAGDVEVTPTPAPDRTLRVDRTAPVISNVRVNQTAGGFELVIVGISPTRDVTSATFQFTPAAGTRLEATQLVVSTAEAAGRWFQDARSSEFGGQFSFVQPFSLQGAALTEVSVTLTNGQGTSQPVRARF